MAIAGHSPATGWPWQVPPSWSCSRSAPPDAGTLGFHALNGGDELIQLDSSDELVSSSFFKPPCDLALAMFGTTLMAGTQKSAWERAGTEMDVPWVRALSACFNDSQTF